MMAQFLNSNSSLSCPPQLFPRVYLVKAEKSESSSSNDMSELVVVQENEKAVANKQLGGSFDSLSSHALIQEVVKASKERKSEVVEIKFLRNMLLLQYLIIILEGDFFPHNSAYRVKVFLCD
ncbi:unnamed protein product [Fraxinus pennsylvanica]|uniref:Uncharacterized protein n=1 Tax=Fraxinus pennsylvanica TaxID=56036 RepID=A0AAD2AJ55_9LAMI|nr:unnamed protein product [Fraxinus pennsylvanica]